MNDRYFLLAITAILVIVCGCSSSSAPNQTTTVAPTSLQTIQPLPVTTIHVPQTTSVSENTIQIKNFAFDPANITVKVGSTVRWENKDSVAHKLQFTDKSISTQILGASQSESHLFVKVGVYEYICSIHPQMHGTVIVE